MVESRLQACLNRVFAKKGMHPAVTFALLSRNTRGSGGRGEALGRVSFIHNGCEKRPWEALMEILFAIASLRFCFLILGIKHLPKEIVC
jgi:hypothetical protein